MVLMSPCPTFWPTLYSSRRSKGNIISETMQNIRTLLLHAFMQDTILAHRNGAISHDLRSVVIKIIHLLKARFLHLWYKQSQSLMANYDAVNSGQTDQFSANKSTTDNCYLGQ